MEDAKISNLTEGTTLATGDLVPFVDVSDTTDAASGTTKKTLISTITTYIASLTQTLTNKTITDSTNNVMAKSLKSATTTVDVSAATAPSSGQVLTATSSTTATWQATALSDTSCRVKQTGVTALTTSWVTCAFAAEDFDTSTMHDNATNNSRITIPTTGKYCCGGTVTVPANSACGARIRLNGTTVISRQIQGNSGGTEGANVSTLYSFTAGDYIELQGYAAATDSSGNADTNFWAFRVA